MIKFDLQSYIIFGVELVLRQRTNLIVTITGRLFLTWLCTFSLDGKKMEQYRKCNYQQDKKTSSWYSFSNKNPIHHENLYQLKMIDLAAGTPQRDRKDGNGTFSFRQIQSLNFDYETVASAISFYHNPVKTC